MVIRVNLCNADLVAGVLEDGGKFLVYRGEVLAVTAPGGKELYEGRLAGLEDNIVEVGGAEVNDGRCRSNGGEQRNGRGYEVAEQHCKG